MTWRTDATNRRADILERSGLVAPSWNLRDLAADFEAQRRSAERMLVWYELYVLALRRCESGETPSALSLYCGAGGDYEGKKEACRGYRIRRGF